MSIACPAFIAALDPALCRAVDIYCERTSASIDSEPLNAFSNIAFLIAAWAAWRLCKRAASDATGQMRLLIGLIALTGLGSFLFHTVATRWAEWGDVIPIVAFMLAYMWFAMTWLFGFGAWSKISIISAFCVVTLALEAGVPSGVLWGGALYVPSLLIAVTVATALRRRGHPAAGSMTLAVATFFLAFAMRSLDSPLCAVLPSGTHFLWHILNAMFLYQLVRIAVLIGVRGARRRALV